MTLHSRTSRRPLLRTLLLITATCAPWAGAGCSDTGDDNGGAGGALVSDSGVGDSLGGSGGAPGGDGETAGDERGGGGGDAMADAAMDYPTCDDDDGPLLETVDGGVTLPAGSCWRVGRTLELSSGQLTIEPGVRIVFGFATGLIVEGGSIVAVGTQDAPIKLVGETNERGHWRGIRLSGSDAPHVLSHVEIANAGNTPWGAQPESRAAIYIDQNALRMTVTDCLLRDNDGAGISTFGVISESSWTVERTTFTGNTVAAIVEGELLHSLAGDLVIEGNDLDRIVVGRTSDTNPHKVTSTRTWAAWAVPVQFEVGIELTAGTLRVQPGAVLLFDAGAGIKVDGGVLDLGGPSAVTTLSRKSDTDVWGGLSIKRSSENVIENAVIEHGGRGGSEVYSAALYVHGSGGLALRDARIEHSPSHGLSVDGSLHECSGVEVSHSAGDDLRGDTGACL